MLPFHNNKHIQIIFITLFLFIYNLGVIAEAYEEKDWIVELAFTLGPETGITTGGHIEVLKHLSYNLFIGGSLNTGFPIAFNEGFGLTLRYYFDLPYISIFIDTAISMLFVKSLRTSENEIATFGHVTPKIGIWMRNFPAIYFAVGPSFRFYEDDPAGFSTSGGSVDLNEWRFNFRIGVMVYTI